MITHACADLKSSRSRLSSPSIGRSASLLWRRGLAPILTALLTVTGCSGFTPRDVHFDNSKDPGSKTCVALVALSEEEYESLRRKPCADETFAEVRASLDSDWKHRSRTLEFRDKADHVIATRGDGTLWNEFRNARSTAPHKHEMCWLALIIVDSNFRADPNGNIWLSAVRAAPANREEAAGDDLHFRWYERPDKVRAVDYDFRPRK